MSVTRNEIAVLDFGSQYSHLICRRIRELNCFCELYSCLVTVEELSRKSLKGIILSGGPASVYEEGAPHVRPEVWAYAEANGLPILGICYGAQELVHAHGGTVERALKREFGPALLSVPDASGLFEGFRDGSQIWMSHSDKVTVLPEGYVQLSSTDSCPNAGFWNPAQRQFGIQFHPEVSHTLDGKRLISNFVLGVCGCPQHWTMSSFVDDATARVRAMVGETGQVIGAVSGGVDSTVAAVLMAKAIGHRFHAVLVDNGLLRKDEATGVLKRLRDECGVDLRCVDASGTFLGALAGVEDPEDKRKIIGRLFCEVFEAECQKIGTVDFLLQGTLYPDVIESISFRGPSVKIKSHHNVGGLPERMRLRLIEPLRELFKDEVRALGRLLGLPEESVMRHPFPGPGLAIRILGPIVPEDVTMLQEADAIFIEELHLSGLYDKISQAGVILLNCKSVGVMGDGRTYERAVALRAVESSDFMTADWFRIPYELLAKVSNRIINEVAGINRVVYDISSKPPATIEWL